MAVARETIALSPVGRNPVVHCDPLALAWIYERITDTRELMRFLAAVPGLLIQYDGLLPGADAWHRAFHVQGSDNTESKAGAMIIRINHSLQAMQDDDDDNLSPLDRRAFTNICVDALYAISSTYVRTFFDYSWEDGWSDGPSRIEGADSPILYTKALCSQVLFSHHELKNELKRVGNPERQDWRRFLKMANKADEALVVVAQLQPIIEQVAEKHRSGQEQYSPNDVAMLLQIYFEVVNSRSRDIEDWMSALKTMVNLRRLGSSRLLQDFYMLPQWGFRVVYQGIPSCTNSVPLQVSLYTHQVWAYLRKLDTFSELSHEELQKMPERWFPFHDKDKRQRTEGISLYRDFSRHRERYPPGAADMEPLSTLLDILHPTLPERNAEIHIPDSRPYAGSGGGYLSSDKLSRLFMKALFASREPLTAFSSILEELCTGRGHLAGYLSLLFNMKQHDPRKLNPSIIRETLLTFYDRG
ncbi:hypothetical protein H0H87_009895, partial [Tephrocybe sp. NHM501043]